MSLVLFAQLPDMSENGGGRAGFVRARAQVQAARDAGVDALLLTDRQSIGPDGSGKYEAGTLAAALAVATENIGLVPSISTEHLAPYHVARLLATVDVLSGGRAGWEIGRPSAVADAANYHARDVAPLRNQRSRADEFTRVVTGLWDSFQDNAFLRDRDSGVYFVPERLHSLDHRGEYFDVAGPLNIARPPQGYPVQVRRIACAEDATAAGATSDVALVPIEMADAAADLAQALTEACRAAGRTPEDVRLLVEQRADTPADHLLRSAEAGYIDGFALIPPAGPADSAHAATVATARALRRQVPGTTGTTLRARLGLRRPAGRSPAA
ncbi:LLM class flavin-dependent oxidoreductase [Nocardia sp. NPDC004604]|uniref:LLM class flavin-dependent oxidoreductase n=1 Tax=Nocardia sp. NPDC004604 TaxID=3157013 RepID=UPI0033A99DFD